MSNEDEPSTIRDGIAAQHRGTLPDGTSSLLILRQWDPRRSRGPPTKDLCNGTALTGAAVNDGTPAHH